jgi:uncharacterized membrane protein YcfT
VSSVLTSPQLATDRRPWLDTARGLAILLVVLYHATLTSAAVGLGSPAWIAAVDALAVIRMPLFFFVSGILSAGVVRRGWRELFATRLLLYAWVYTVWWSITAGVEALTPRVRPEQVSSLSEWLSGFVVPSNEIWYLWALGLFVLLARLTRRAPSWLVLGGTGALSVVVAADLLNSRFWVLEYMAMYLVVYLVGTRFSLSVRRLTATARPHPLPAWLAVLTAAGVLLVVVRLDLMTVPLVRPAVTALALTAGVVWCLWASRLTLFAPLGAVGRRTLPVYVLHQMVMDVFAWTTLSAVPPTGLATGLTPALLAAVVLAVCIGLERLLSPLPFLFALPSRRWRTWRTRTHRLPGVTRSHESRSTA